MKQINVDGRIYEYKEEDCLGKGNFGAAYKGIDRQTGGEIAIKKIPRTLFRQYGRDFRDAVGAEVLIPQQLCLAQQDDPCPFLVSILDCCETTNNVYIMQVFCNGGSVEDLTKKQPNECLPEKEAKFIIYQVVLALDYLSSRGIMHRDLKPDNVFIHDGVCKIGDFGFASMNPTETGEIGTMTFMAPEYFGRTPYNKQVDIWALGAMYHKLLFGQFAFYGTSQQDLKHKIKQNPYALKAHQEALVSAESKDFLLRCLDKNPATRLTAQQAKVHKLFEGILQTEPRLSRILEASKVQPVAPRDSGARKTSFAIVYCRNAMCQLVATAEKLLVHFTDACRFEAYYILKRATHILFTLIACVRQRAPGGVPKLFADVSASEWAEFLGNAQYYDNVVVVLDTVWQVLPQLLEQTVDHILKFAQQAYPNHIAELQFTINSDAKQDVEHLLYSEQLADCVNSLVRVYEEKKGRDPVNARLALQVALEVKVALNIYDVLGTQKFNFDEYHETEVALTNDQILNRLHSF